MIMASLSAFDPLLPLARLAFARVFALLSTRVALQHAATMQHEAPFWITRHQGASQSQAKSLSLALEATASHVSRDGKTTCLFRCQ